MNNKGYYSEPMEVLPGRLHVASYGITLELILNDFDGKRRMVSMPLEHTSCSKLKDDWEECKSRSNNGETGNVETADRILLLGDHPAMTIYKTFGRIDDDNVTEKISKEIEEATRRGYQIQTLLFTSDNKTSEPDASHSSEPVARKKRPRIHKENTSKPAEKANQDNSTVIKDAGENAKQVLGDLIEALGECSEDKQVHGNLPPRSEHVSAPMPDMNNYNELGNAPFLQMIRDLSFNSSDTDMLRSKAVLLISVMDFIAAGKISTPKIVPTNLLRKKYEAAWKRNVGRECTKDYKTAFLILNDERFWRLETTMNDNYGESEIRGIKFAKMDDQLFKAMMNGEDRGKLRLILTSRCK